MNNAHIDRALGVWRGLQPRERMFVAVGAAAVGALLLYFLLWAPLQRDLARLRVDTPRAAEQVQWMRAQMGRVRQLRGAVPAQSTAGGVLSFIEQSAAAYNVKQNIKRLEPEGTNGARVLLDGVSFNDLVSWLANLQKQGSVRVDNATLQAQPTPGIVNAHLSLRATGG